MAVGDTITAARFNQLQARVATILGKGAGNEGYGQAVTSSQVSANTTIEAEHMSDLFEDMKRCRVHQTGSIPAEIADIDIGNLIEDSNTTSKKGVAQYEGLSLDVVNDRLNIAAGQASVEAGVESFNFGIKSSTLKTFANANGLKFLPPNNRDLSNKDLGQLITEATIYLECHMTVAKIKRLIAEEKNRKAFFSEYK